MSRRMGEAFWAQHVASAKQSGPSAITYAAQHGILVKRLYFWQRKFAAAGTDTDTHKHTGAFVAVSVPAMSSGCTLTLPSGLRLEMETLPTSEWLVAMLTLSSDGFRRAIPIKHFLAGIGFFVTPVLQKLLKTAIYS